MFEHDKEPRITPACLHHEILGKMYLANSQLAYLQIYSLLITIC